MRSQHITTLQLKRLLVELLEHAQETSIRVRVMGELWQTHFMRVVNVSHDRFLLNDEIGNRLVSFLFSSIIQIEMDHRFQQYEPYNHYDVIPDGFGSTILQHALTTDPQNPDEIV